MGLAIILVISGYILGIMAVMGVIALLVRKLPGKTIAIILFVVGFVSFWPIWVPLFTGATYKLLCNYGETGLNIYKPFDIGTITVNRPYAMSATWHGKPDEFISNCTEPCIRQLNHLYSYSLSWESIEHLDIAVEIDWYYNSYHNNKHLIARLWISPNDSPDCVAPLRKGRYKETHCIAGKEIEKITSPYEFDFAPYANSRRESGGSVYNYKSSMVWRRALIEKHQFHLKYHNEIVATYSWYDWDFLSYFGIAGNCPDGDVPTHAKERVFWNKIFNNPNQLSEKGDGGI